ncbi:TPA: nuclease domain-containing protein [Escherichia coli]
MADLRKAARGRECQVRIPGVCNGNPDTSVLAHIRLPVVRGGRLELTITELGDL